MTEETKPIPKIIFIVPYRDRKEHLEHFISHMKTVLEDYEPNDYRFFRTPMRQTVV